MTADAIGVFGSQHAGDLLAPDEGRGSLGWVQAVRKTVRLCYRPERRAPLAEAPARHKNIRVRKMMMGMVTAAPSVVRNTTLEAKSGRFLNAMATMADATALGAAVPMTRMAASGIAATSTQPSTGPTTEYAM